MFTRTRRLALLGLAIGVLLALVAAPQTRWLVRLQALTSLNLYHPLPLLGMASDAGNNYFTSEVYDARLMHRVAERHPNDYATQYAYAVSKPGAQETLVALRALSVRFPEEPSLYTNILRHETRGDVKLSRVEDLMGHPMPDGYKPEPPSSPAALTAFDQDAATGERIDPENAYFPLMRAVGLFEAHRDAEGLAAVHQASLKRYWREYMTDDVHNQWRMHEETFGDPGGLGRIALFSQTLLPQYTGLRAVARVATYKATQAEQAGHAERGLAIRQDLIRCGDLMRDESTSYVGSLVGFAITSVATSQPGGSVSTPLQNASRLTPKQTFQNRLDLYCAYLRRIRHPEDAQAARADLAVSEKVYDLGSGGVFDQIEKHDARLVFWWLAGLTALANLFWLLTLGGLAAALARRRQVREAKPLSRGVSEGFWTALVPSLGLLTLLLAPPQTPGTISPMDDLAFLLAVLVGIPLAGFGIGAILTPHLRPLIGSGIRAALGTLAAILTFGALAAWQIQGLGNLWGGFRSLTDLSGGVNDADGQAARLGLIAVSTASGLAIPFLLILVSTIAALARRVPISVGLIRGFQAAAVPLACLLIVVYGGLTLATVRQDTAVREEAERIVTGESQYLAEKTGQPWLVSAR